MPKKRVYISSRINEMRDFREAAVKAIEDAGMKPIYFDSTDPEKRWPLKPGVPIIQQLIEGVKSADAFLGLYGQTLNTNWTPDGYSKHSMELEYEAAEAAHLPCFCYVTPPGVEVDEHMARFRKQIMQKAVEFLSRPENLYNDLLAQLHQLRPRIFVSYSSKDDGFVNRLCARLESSGHHVWLNTESIPKGELWHSELVKGLSETDLLLLMLSPDAVASKYVEMEWKTFIGMNKKVIPILYKECDIPQEINRLQMIDAKNEDDDWYYDLKKTIEQNL